MKLPNRMILEALGSESARPERVLEVLQSFALPQDSTLTVISIEVWTTYFILRWEFRGNSDDPSVDGRLQEGLDWHAVDNDGTSYQGGDFGGGGGNSNQWIYNSIFAPALNPSAQLLEVMVGALVTDKPETLRIVIR